MSGPNWSYYRSEITGYWLAVTEWSQCIPVCPIVSQCASVCVMVWWCDGVSVPAVTGLSPAVVSVLSRLLPPPPTPPLLWPSRHSSSPPTPGSSPAHCSPSLERTKDGNNYWTISAQSELSVLCQLDSFLLQSAPTGTSLTLSLSLSLFISSDPVHDSTSLPASHHLLPTNCKVSSLTSSWWFVWGIIEKGK